MILDILVRVSSAVVAILVARQLFVSNWGSLKHRRAGRWTMAVGAVLLASVMARGFLTPASGTLYTVHLVTGIPFFIAFFLTGFLGWLSEDTPLLGSWHKLAGRTAGILMILSLSAGIWSRLSH